MSDYAIKVKDLTLEFPKVRAVDGLTFDVPRGGIFGFLGPNGSGKTTTIHLLLGLLEPTKGRAEVLGFDTAVEGERIREGSGALLEHTGHYEQLTAAENLEFFARVARIPREERSERIAEQLNWIGLWARRDDRVGTWSRGMKQKLALARALLHRPSLVFLDEPTAGLDVMIATEVREKLSELVADGKTTIFLTTHNLSEVERICQQVAIIKEGALLTLDTPSAIVSKRNAKDLEEAFVRLLRGEDEP